MGILDYVQERGEEKTKRVEADASWLERRLRAPLPCPKCNESFTSYEELHRHTAGKHASGLLGHPVLKLNGFPLPRNFVVRTQFGSESWEVSNCDRCVIVGGNRPAKEIDPSALPALLAERTQGFLRINLTGVGIEPGDVITSTIDLSFRVLSVRETTEIDAKFLAATWPEELTVAAADEFFEKFADASEAVREYAGALSNYIIGCAVKENRAEGDHISGFENYKMKFNEAPCLSV